MYRFLIEAIFAFSAGSFYVSAVPFPCPIVRPAKGIPTNVTQLHPAHVSVIMAMGDSITAGFAAKSWLSAESASGKDSPLLPSGRSLGGSNRATTRLGHASALPLEYRGISFSVGEGSDTAWTLPYFFHHYNDTVAGFSRGWQLPQLPDQGYADEVKNGLNAALTNAHSWNLDAEMAELRKQSHQIDDFAGKWKLLTILVGANDLCDGNSEDQGGITAACNGEPKHRMALADRFEDNLRSVLVKIRDSFARIIVQLVPMFSLKSVSQVRADVLWCNAVGVARSAFNECACIDKPISGDWGKPGEEQLNNLDATVDMFNQKISNLTREFNLQREDFAVIEQASFAGQSLPDSSYLSDLDCFHPSSKAHGAMATALWNGLFDASRKPKPIDASSVPMCPTPDTVIQVAQHAVESDNVYV
jgi:phospholipase B1